MMRLIAALLIGCFLCAPVVASEPSRDEIGYEIYGDLWWIYKSDENFEAAIMIWELQRIQEDLLELERQREAWEQLLRDIDEFLDKAYDDEDIPMS